jgi:hypothetical protein
MTKLPLTAVLVAAVCTGAACSSNNSSSLLPTTSTTQTTTTDVLTGTVPAAINGVMQSAFNQFVVGQGGGSVTVTLTSAIETLGTNSFVANVTMGLAVGTPANGVCTPLSTSSTVQTVPNGTSLAGTLSAGTYCVLVQDVTGQLGPVTYSVSVSHP